MSSKQLRDLTADDVQSACDSLGARLKLSKEDACEYLGLIASPTVGQPCGTLKDQCLSAADEPAAEQDHAADCMPPTEHRAGCSVTVAEYEVCLLAQTQRVRALTCDSEVSSLDTPPPECDVVARKCPQILEAGETGAEGAESP
ncbi:hypothetical protein [Sorangium sp. So ce1000]|uniref:hypothetical protein n=1 Tax=Sorangium sp. So ce1000 TaxID=3133325 RepID=UPI003F623751